MAFLNSRVKDDFSPDVIEQFIRVINSVIDVILAFLRKLQLSKPKVIFEERFMYAIQTRLAIELKGKKIVEANGRKVAFVQQGKWFCINFFI